MVLNQTQVIISILLVIVIAIIILFTIYLIRKRTRVKVINKRIKLKDYKPPYSLVHAIVVDENGEVDEEKSKAIDEIYNIKDLIKAGFGNYKLIFTAVRKDLKAVSIIIGEDNEK